MQAKNYDKAIADAAKKLCEFYFLSDSVIIGYDDFRAGFILGISTVFGVAPQQVDDDIKNFTE